MTNHIILFLAANPRDTERLMLDQEARAIQAELDRSGHRDRFELVTRWAVQPLDLLRELRRLKPTIVHFSGHGGRGMIKTGRGQRDVVCAADTSMGAEHNGWLCFQDHDGSAHVVSTAAIARAFSAAGSSVKVVVLNACFSEANASALLLHVDCVVGVAGPIHDKAATAFAVGFYGGLAEGEPIEAAYRQGCAAMGLDGLADCEQLQFRVASDHNMHVITFADGSIHRAPRDEIPSQAEHVIDVTARQQAGATPIRAALWFGAAIFACIAPLWLMLKSQDGPPLASNAPLTQQRTTSSDAPPESGTSAKSQSSLPNAIKSVVAVLSRTELNCKGLDAASPMCSFRGVLRKKNGEPMSGTRVELMGTDCEMVTSKFGIFDFSTCDPRQTQRLAHPGIFLHLVGEHVLCEKIPLSPPPLVTEIRIDPATCRVLRRTPASNIGGDVELGLRPWMEPTLTPHVLPLDAP